MTRRAREVLKRHRHAARRRLVDELTATKEGDMAKNAAVTRMTDRATSVFPVQLLELVVRPALAAIGLGGEASEMLVMGTAAQESKFGAIAQVGGGPALSMWQIEPETARDVFVRSSRVHNLRTLCAEIDGHEDYTQQLPGNLYLGAALCRLKYYLSPFTIPVIAGRQVLDMASTGFLWKKYYNTEAGAGTEAEFAASWKAFDLDRLWIPKGGK